MQPHPLKKKAGISTWLTSYTFVGHEVKIRRTHKKEKRGKGNEDLWKYKLKWSLSIEVSIL